MRKSLAKRWPLALVIVLILFLPACNNGQDNVQNDMTPDNDNLNNMQQRSGIQPYRTLDRSRNYHMTRENNRFGADRTDMRGGVHANTRMEVSKEIADEIVKLDEVRTANVLLTDRNAYVAVVMEDGSEQANFNGANLNGANGMDDDVSDRIKQKIAAKVREVAPHCQNVFISANPDFVDRINGLVDGLAEGRPLRGMVREFNTMVERMFPENR